MKNPPIYRLLFSNGHGRAAQNPVVIDAAHDDQALQIAKGLLVRFATCEATLWTDERCMRRYRPRDQTISDQAVRVRAEQLRAPLRDTTTEPCQEKTPCA